MFYNGDLQSAIETALRERKAVLCFVSDRSTQASTEWEAVLRDPSISPAVTSQAVAVLLYKDSTEAGFLTSICPINSTPAIIVIKNARVQENLQSADVSTEQLKSRLASAFGIQQDGDGGSVQQPEPQQSEPEDESDEYLHLEPASGDPNNAYDALRNHTQKLLNDGNSPAEIFQTQLALLSNIPILRAELGRLRHIKELSEYARSRLLRLPAAALGIPVQDGLTPSQATTSPESYQSMPSRPSSNPQVPVPAGERVYPPQTRATLSPSPSSARSTHTEPPAPAPIPPPSSSNAEIDSKQKAQRAEYIKMQREREQKQREERERIKAQIKADREERRLMDEMKKHGQTQENPTSSASSSYGRSKTSRTNARADVRVQVRTFDGSTLRNTFPPTSTITKEIRPWIDSASSSSSPDRTSGVPYNLKLILTPLPNRTIEAGEEEAELSDLGIVGSCTFVMVPVTGYVESYSSGGMGSGLLGGVVTGGYNLVSGAAGMVFGGVRSLLGYGSENAEQISAAGGRSEKADHHPPGAGGSGTGNNVRIRTLADQRAEEAAKRDQQFYNGNQLNFQPNDDADDHKKD
ncbi:uncharacterized protein Z519_05569 [Cladophialophora bantiana CBS 173.52]|uniref:UBX domain-containing protein n=1 Tax=Cladophialophora bantiana (strain ATCC 10958 / CBS 173.52 / CDC B-1940 / NIH 8579) TaxID=1442370 RepID=A0A0D2HLQ3_CLAB1|nr:uncharacterized protein Z519_05569 [Cladophialophora bantiana CBS 173.52]KIW94253.1 hypothetical protein Z519_05569 [Cladophialophora bantiana CBS 173.52]